MSQNPRTLFIVSDRHLREQIKKDLLSECRGANVKLYEPDGKAHYGDLGAHEEQRFRVALKKRRMSSLLSRERMVKTWQRYARCLAGIGRGAFW